MNKVWHQTHRMPKNPTLAQRAEWHLLHQQHCDCRPMPATLQQFLKEHPPKKQ